MTKCSQTNFVPKNQKPKKICKKNKINKQLKFYFCPIVLQYFSNFLTVYLGL